MTGANHAMTLIKQELNRRKTQRDLQEENGRAAVYSMDYRQKYDLVNEEWKYDIMPENVDDKNIADFVDPEIMAKLEQLQQEEEETLCAIQIPITRSLKRTIFPADILSNSLRL